MYNILSLLKSNYLKIVRLFISFSPHTTPQFGCKVALPSSIYLSSSGDGSERLRSSGLD